MVKNSILKSYDIVANTLEVERSLLGFRVKDIISKKDYEIMMYSFGYFLSTKEKSKSAIDFIKRIYTDINEQINGSFLAFKQHIKTELRALDTFDEITLSDGLHAIIRKEKIDDYIKQKEDYSLYFPFTFNIRIIRYNNKFKNHIKKVVDTDNNIGELFKNKEFTKQLCNVIKYNKKIFDTMYDIYNNRAFTISCSMLYNIYYVLHNFWRYKDDDSVIKLSGSLLARRIFANDKGTHSKELKNYISRLYSLVEIEIKGIDTTDVNICSYDSKLFKKINHDYTELVDTNSDKYNTLSVNDTSISVAFSDDILTTKDSNRIKEIMYDLLDYINNKYLFCMVNELNLLSGFHRF